TLPDVQVANGRLAERSAVAGLVAHLDLDVFAVAADFYPVEDIGKGFHSVGHVAVPEIFSGRDELDPKLFKLPLRNTGIDIVTKSPRAHIDDDTVHILVF